MERNSAHDHEKENYIYGKHDQFTVVFACVRADFDFPLSDFLR